LWITWGKGLWGEKRGLLAVTRIIERVKAHYEVHEVELGIVYRWCPERAVLKCECGEKLSLTAATTACGECGADHANIVEEVVDFRQEDTVDHPWRSLPPYYAPTRGA
jgi:hypothetical protein